MDHSTFGSIDPTSSFPAFYNAVLGPRGFYFPPHLIPVATALADDRITKLMAIIGPGSGKSQAISTIYPCYRLGRNNDLTILEISAGEDLPKGFMRASMGIIEHSKHFQRLFPSVKPDKKAGWSTDAGMYVQGRPLGDPDPSFFACGIGSKALTGKHAKLIILDDIHDADNSANPAACNKVIDRYYNQILGRADPSGAKFLLAGRRWSEWDIYGHLMKSGEWVALRLPAERTGEKSLYHDVYVPYEREPGVPYECVFTEGGAQEVESDDPSYRKFRAYYGVDPKGQGFYWPASEHKRKEYFAVKRNRPAEAASVYQGDPSGRNAGIFLEEDFRLSPMGHYDRLLPALVPKNFWAPGTRVVQAWDTAHEQNPDSDYSVCVTALITPCTHWHNGENEDAVGKPDGHYDVLVVDVLRRKMKFDELVHTVREQAQIWEPSFVAIEKTVGSTALIQSLSNSLPITPIQTGNKSKKARATIAVGAGSASAQGWMRLGRVKFWAEAPWLDDLKREMINFSGDGSGHDDQTDAVVILLTQAILLGSGMAMMPSEDLVGFPEADPRMQRVNAGFLQALAEMEAEKRAPENTLKPGLSPAMIPNDLPVHQICGNCKFRDSMGICAKQQRKTVAIESCYMWSHKGGTF